MKHRTSKIWTIKTEDLQKLIDSSATFTEVLRYLGLNEYSGNHRTLNKRIKEDNIGIEKLNNNRKMFLLTKNSKRMVPFEKVFSKESSVRGDVLKKRILKEKIIEYKCNKCGNDGSWMGEKITLQIDHINGTSNDNRIENLRFLCPNCHSQTLTFSGKNSSIKGRNSRRDSNSRRDICCCGKSKDKKAKLCWECYKIKEKKEKTRIPHLTKTELEKLILELPIVKVAKMFSVSDNAIRKYCVRFGIDYKKISRFSRD